VGEGDGEGEGEGVGVGVEEDDCAEEPDDEPDEELDGEPMNLMNLMRNSCLRAYLLSCHARSHQKHGAYC